jgi:hypothetical protein
MREAIKTYVEARSRKEEGARDGSFLLECMTMRRTPLEVADQLPGRSAAAKEGRESKHVIYA